MFCSVMIRYPHYIFWKKRCKSCTACRESNILFWFFFFSTSLALRCEKSGTVGCNCDWITGKFAHKQWLIKSSAELKLELKGRELFCKSTWPYKVLQLLQKALYSFDCPFSLAILLGESGAASGMKKAIFLCKLLVLY